MTRLRPPSTIHDDSSAGFSPGILFGCWKQLSGIRRAGKAKRALHPRLCASSYGCATIRKWQLVGERVVGAAKNWVLRHCEEHSDEAIQLFRLRTKLDCFASLAVTVLPLEKRARPFAYPTISFSSGSPNASPETLPALRRGRGAGRRGALPDAPSLRSGANLSGSPRPRP